MGEIAKAIIFVGIVLVVIGIVMLLLPKALLPGRLPGDIVIKRDNFTFYFPVVTSLVVSIIISLILYLIGKFR